MKYFLILLVSIFYIAAQEKLPSSIENALKSIDSENMILDAKTLSSPKYKGREPGTEGSISSGEYIAQKFREAKLLPAGDAGSYFSYFQMCSDYDINASMQISYKKQQTKTFAFSKDFTLLHVPEGKTEISASFAFVGYGITSKNINFDEYKNVNIKGRIAVVFSGVPWNRQANSWISKIPETKNFDSISYKVNNAISHGAKAVIIVDNPIGWRGELYVDKLKTPGVFSPLKVEIPVLHITHECLSAITKLKEKELNAIALGIRKDMTPESIPFYERKIILDIEAVAPPAGGRNIIGILPGSDPNLKKEAIVIGAHYDHLGEMDQSIYCGANDNASGTSAVIAIAHAFGRLLTPPKRTIIFVAFDAEECGLQGSEFYVQNPVVPIEDTVLMINFDMIGRNEINEIYAVGTRSSKELHEIHRKMNQHVKLDIRNPDSFRLGLSDHSSFYYANIPIMYLFGGLDIDYHSPQDTWEKLIPLKMQQTARLAFLTAWNIANLEKRIELVEEDN